MEIYFEHIDTERKLFFFGLLYHGHCQCPGKAVKYAAIF